MDRIEFKLNKENNKVVINLYINGTKIENEINHPSELMGDQIYSINYNHLVFNFMGESLHYGERIFLPIYCDCGLIDCFGEATYNSLTNRKNKIIWTLRGDITKRHFGSKKLKFDKNQYKDEINKLILSLFAEFDNRDLLTRDEMNSNAYIVYYYLNNYKQGYKFYIKENHPSFQFIKKVLKTV